MALTPPAANTARGFPAYPSTCPIVHRPSYYQWSPDCLIDEQTVVPPQFNAPFTNERSSIGIRVTPSVVRYGQKFTVSAITSLPPCVFPDIPSVPTGCFNKDTGFTGIYLRLLPLTRLEYVTPQFYPNVRQQGHCYAPTHCTFWFVRPQGPTGPTLTSHWIVAIIQATINLGIPQDVNRAGWLQNPARLETLVIEKAIRLCPPSAPCSHEVSGRVSQKGSNGQGVGGVPVRARCGSGGRTTTDPDGNYSFVLDPGTCRISVEPPAGETVTPKQQVVHVSTQNVSGVNFQVGCGDATKAARVSAADSGPGCLDVRVKTIGPSRSGLAVYRHFSADEASKAFFLPPFSKQCASGCTNVLVTVTNPTTHQPVTGATVNASVNEIQGVTGGGFLCDQSAPKNCGTHVLGLTTDNEGQVHLLYWAPGLIKDQSPKVRVIARDGVKEGSGETNFTVKDYVIYQHTGTLTREGAEELAFWPAGKTLVGRLGKLIGGVGALEKTLGFSLGFLIGAEIAAEKAEQILALTEKATPIAGALELAHFGSELWERQGFIATFLKTLDLSPIGLAADPAEPSASAAPTQEFEDELANLGTAAPFHVAAAGVLWEYAKALLFRFEHNDVAFGAQFVHVKIYEVSYCKQGEFCGPGYRNYLAGIQPELYVVISADRNRRAQSFPPHTFTIPYDPNAWTEANHQHDLKGLFG